MGCDMSFVAVVLRLLDGPLVRLFYVLGLKRQVDPAPYCPEGHFRPEIFQKQKARSLHSMARGQGPTPFLKMGDRPTGFIALTTKGRSA